MTNDRGRLSRPCEQDHRRSLPRDTGEALLEGTVTIGFADLVDSTTLVRRIGDVAYTTLIDELDATSRSLAQPRRGHVPRHEGDGWMAVFGAARRALWWAAELQHAVTVINSRTGYDIAIRVGLHTGEAVQSGQDFHGMHVNYASRVSGAAPGGSVYVTSLTAQIARGAPEFVFTNPQLVHLRGFDEPAELFELDWQSLISSGEAPARDEPTGTTP